MQQKNKDELSSILRNLAASAELKELTFENHLSSYFRCVGGFSPTPTLVWYDEQHIKQYDKAINLCWKNDPEIHQTISEETIKTRIDSLISNSYETEKPITKLEIEELFNDLKAIPKIEGEILHPLYGTKLSTPEPLKLGQFTVYNWELHESHITQKYPHLIERIAYQSFLKNAKELILVSVKVLTRDSSRAQEVTYSRFRQFENVMRYMIENREGRIDVGIFDYHNWTYLKSILLSNTNAWYSSRGKGAHKPVDINNPFFRDSNTGHAWIWDTLSKENPCDMQKRVIAAIEWVGKGLRDPDPAKAFVQFVFAIEALLTFQKKDVLVSPSIASQLAEYSAFILGSDYDSRLKVEKLVKKLYAHRSAIAHGGSQSDLESEVYEALWLVKSLITRIITEEELVAMTSIDKLQEWVSRQKYS